MLLITNVCSLEDDVLFNKLYSLVSTHRKNDIEKHKNKVNKHLSLSTEILLKYGFELLGENIDLEDIDYKNKPKINNYSFNFSHSGNYTICAISKQEVGCDIELIHDYNLEVAKRFFHINEYNNLLSIDNLEERRKQFYKYWTAKEAFVKNIGSGINTSLNDFEIIFNNEVTIRQNKNNNNYYFNNFDFDNYVVCVCSLNNDNYNIINVDLKRAI